MRWLLLCLAAPLAAQGSDFDVLIAGAGDPWFHGDVGIRGDVIAFVDNSAGRTARTRIDARGKR